MGVPPLHSTYLAYFTYCKIQEVVAQTAKFIFSKNFKRIWDKNSAGNIVFLE